jgi:hypothetical protein
MHPARLNAVGDSPERPKAPRTSSYHPQPLLSLEPAGTGRKEAGGPRSASSGGYPAAYPSAYPAAGDVSLPCA